MMGVDRSFYGEVTMRKVSSSATPHRAVAGGVGSPMAAGVQFHASGLLFTANPNLYKWEQLGTKLFSFADSSTWWIADWLVYGESTFRDRYEEAIKRTSLSYQTLRNYTWVARRFPLPRRRQGLSFSHHLEVVALQQHEQDYWLRKAEEQHWSRNKLRGEVRSSMLAREGEPARLDAGDHGPAGRTDAVAARRASTPTSVDAKLAPETHLLSLKLSPEDLAKFERAAGHDEQSIETWAARILRRAVTGS
ncbi:LmbU family transcriptional regulator [Actinoplanes sp. NPDC023801]|uniref:LmbU family transcriptional regulator n=1 Tax=Actinoplanes sp. NPDC023801 TaxID=3154595 RepID=UPI0033C4F1C9